MANRPVEATVSKVLGERSEWPGDDGPMQTVEDVLFAGGPT